MANWMTKKGGAPGMSHAKLGVPPKSVIPVRLRGPAPQDPALPRPMAKRMTPAVMAPAPPMPTMAPPMAAPMPPTLPPVAAPMDRSLPMAKNWIAGAVGKPGALHADLGVPQGQKIGTKKIAMATKLPGVVGQRARLAQTLGKMPHPGGK